jgi:predicted nucleic acid-binding protein
MSRFFCYTTVFNAAELFSMCRTSAERRTVEDVMVCMKVLGLNGKSAKNIGRHIARSRRESVVDVGSLVAGVCLESHLPLLTGSGSRYRGFRSLRILDAAGIVHSLEKGIV